MVRPRDHEIAVSRKLADRGTEFCGKPERHEYELYLAIEDIDHTRTKAELQKDLDAWLVEYNETRPHQGRWCYGKTPMETFLDTLPVAKEKLMQAA